MKYITTNGLEAAALARKEQINNLSTTVNNVIQNIKNLDNMRFTSFSQLGLAKCSSWELLSAMPANSIGIFNLDPSGDTLTDAPVTSGCLFVIRAQAVYRSKLELFYALSGSGHVTNYFGYCPNTIKSVLWYTPTLTRVN